MGTPTKNNVFFGYGDSFGLERKAKKKKTATSQTRQSGVQKVAATATGGGRRDSGNVDNFGVDEDLIPDE